MWYRPTTESTTWLHKLKVKVILQGHVVHPPIPVRSISPETIEQYSWNFTKFFILVRRCAEHMNKLPRLKVNVTGQVHAINPWILCPLHILTLRAIFIYIRPNVPLSKTMCRICNSATQTEGQCHILRLCDLPFNFCPFHFSWTFWTIFIKLHPNYA